MNNRIEPVRIFKALSEDTRLRILWLLDEHELSVNDVVEILNSTQSRISRHLNVLKEAGFLNLRREGTWAYYRKSDEEDMPLEIAQSWKLVRDWSKGRPEAKQDRRKLREVLQKKRAQSRNFFGQLASRWDSIRTNLCGELVTYQALESLIPPSLVIADIGTGTGYLLLQLARFAQKVIGVDHSTEMIALAKAKAVEAGIHNVEFRIGELDDLPMADNEVDAVFAGLVLHHAPDPQSAIEEMARIVKPGGTVTILDLQRHEEEWMREELADTWLGFNETDLRRWFSKAGLGNMQWIDGIPNLVQENGKSSKTMKVKSFVFYGRKAE